MLKRAKEVIMIEAEAVKGLLNKLDANFTKAIELIAKCQGRVVVCGMGKSGIIGRKIAATFSSTGTPSVYLHSAEAVHGDLGQLTRRDILIVISQSGETEETVRLLPAIKKIGATTIAMTGNLKSSLAKYSEVVLNTSVNKEGCPLGLAPMASTTATLALGDALAACLIDRRGFKKEDFAFNHPGGSLGRRLLLKVEDIMRCGDSLAVVKANVKVKDVLLTITKARSGCACVVDTKGMLLGIFTDGDLRRHLKEGAQVLNQSVSEVMTKKPTTVFGDKLAAQAFDILKTKRIDELPVVDFKNKVIGLVDVQDLLKSRVGMKLKETLSKIKVVVMDIDGVLTDGRIIIDSHGVETKNFDVQDGLGIVLLQAAGLKTAVISARESNVTKIRCEDLRIHKVFIGAYPKTAAYEEMLKDFAVKEEEVCFIGDDVVDLCVLKRVGLAVAVKNAVDEVKKVAHYVTDKKGGHGAVREVIELILKAQDKWKSELYAI